MSVKKLPNLPISAEPVNSIYWFRKGQRLHDNPALLHALENSTKVYPIFILDPWFVQNAKVGPNRWRFLLQSLNDLDKNLRKRNSRLLLLKGQVLETLKEKVNEWKISMLCFESDTEPYAKQRDTQVGELMAQLNVKLVTKCSHTLYDPNFLFKKNGNKVCLSYQAFGTLISKIGEPEPALPEPINKFNDLDLKPDLYKLPHLKELGVDETTCGPCLYPGGETEALKRFHLKFENQSWISSFEKPNTSPNSLLPSTTVLSPYLKFGNISPRLFYSRLKEVYKQFKKHSLPPVSLEGQLLWREFFYFVGNFTENFDKVKGNSICRQINWDNDETLLQAWAKAKTGFPFIDAIMTQLAQEGWIHHLARHAVACFLTRGDLYQSWEKGQDVFEEHLLDADWSLNAANWQWLSASTFFHQYWKCYSPIEFGKKTDPNGDYIRKYLPVFKNFPSKYIFEPWMAPPAVQQTAKCVIGKDYPKPIVDHKIISKTNMARMKIDYEKHAAKTAGNKVAAKSPKAEPVSQAKPSTSRDKSNDAPKVKVQKRAKSPKSNSDDDKKPPSQQSKRAKIDQFFKSSKKSS